MTDPHLKGSLDGYQVEEWLTLVNSGQPGPIYDAELFQHADYGPAYRKGLAEGRARYIDECLERMASVRDSSGWRGVGLSTEGIPDPRDNGPYETAEQALAAMDQANYGIPVDGLEQLRALAAMQIHGALLMTGVVSTRYEEAALRSLPEAAGTDAAQVITGWIMRAWLSGHVAGVRVGEANAEREANGDDDEPGFEQPDDEEFAAAAVSVLLGRLRTITRETLRRNTGRHDDDFGLAEGQSMADLILSDWTKTSAPTWPRRSVFTLPGWPD